MDKSLQIVIKQMGLWAKQYNLQVTDEFKSLYNNLGYSSTFNFNPGELKGLYRNVEKNYSSINPEIYTVDGVDIQKEYELSQAKIVNIKENRHCRHCNRQLPAGTKALTSVVRLNGRGKRVWFCADCANKLVAEAKRKSAQLYDNEEPDWDDGRSSNGY